MAYAWENWDTVSVMANPTAYLYTVGRSRTRWHQRLAAASSIADEGSLDKSQDPDLIRALAQLSARQRECVVLIEALGFTYREASELLGISRSSVQRHTERALAKLRKELHEGGHDG